MINFLTSIVLASLLIPTGLNFFTEKPIDYSYISKVNQGEVPKRIINNSFGLKTTAQSILVLDNNSDAILYQKDSSAILPVASVTKLMTALVFMETNPDWDEIVEIIDEDQVEGGLVRLFSGEEVKVKDLFYLALVSSANEAAMALARISEIEDFVSAMNKKAAELGMADTYFIDPAGIDPANVSSAVDLLKLADVVFDETEIVDAVTTRAYSFEIVNNQRQAKSFNTNQLLDSFLNYGDYEILGAKTGYLDEAGYCFLFKVKNKDEKILTIAILGSETKEDRWQEAKGLVDWIFRNYNWPN